MKSARDVCVIYDYPVTNSVVCGTFLHGLNDFELQSIRASTPASSYMLDATPIVGFSALSLIQELSTRRQGLEP